MDYESKKTHYIEFLKNRKSKIYKAFSMFFFILFSLYIVICMIYNVDIFYSWRRINTDWYVWHLPLILTPISIITLFLSLKIKVKPNSYFDLFIIAEMKGITKKLKSKGVNLNIDKKDTIINEINSKTESNKKVVELDKLFSLFEKGALSEEEYKKLKEELLNNE